MKNYKMGRVKYAKEKGLGSRHQIENYVTFLVVRRMEPGNPKIPSIKEYINKIAARALGKKGGG